MDSAVAWLLLVGFATLMYVILDGFDLGIGILSGFAPQPLRLPMMRSIVHVWDGNETWLVFAGVILYAAFPKAYAVVLSSLYVPVTLMLLALVFRGVAFEYRFKADSSAKYWDFSFAAGSLVAAFCQGILAGALVQGLPESAAQQTSHWLTPFTVFCGFALVLGYCLLACGWLSKGGERAVRDYVVRQGRRLAWLVASALALLSLVMMWQTPLVRERWLELPQLAGQAGWLLLWLLPMTAVFALWRFHQHLNRQGRAAYWWAVVVFLTAFAGLVAALFPYVIPRQATIWQVLAPQASLQFLLPGVVCLLPLILAYTLWGYRIFSRLPFESEQA